MFLYCCHGTFFSTILAQHLFSMILTYYPVTNLLIYFIKHVYCFKIGTEILIVSLSGMAKIIVVVAIERSPWLLLDSVLRMLLLFILSMNSSIRDSRFKINLRVKRVLNDLKVLQPFNDNALMKQNFFHGNFYVILQVFLIFR